MALSDEMRVGRTHRTPLKATMGLLLTAALLSGCAVGPDYAVPMLDLPTKWMNAGRSTQKPTQIQRWWVKLNDPLLNQLIEEAVAGNLNVASAKAAIREARATLRQTSAGLFPSLDGSGAATRMKTGGVSGGALYSGPTYNTVSAGLDASWEIDLFGSTRRGIEAATRGAEASEDQLYATLLTLIGDVSSYYAQARGYQARIELAQRTAKSQRETADLTRARLTAGTASGVDVAKAEATAASTEAAIPTYRTAYAESVHRLGILLGREPGAVAARMKRGGPIPTPRRALPAGIPAQVLVNRPDIRAVERQLAQATALIAQAEAQRYPSLTLSGSLTTTGTKLGDLGKASSISWAVGPALSVPIFNAGKLEAAVEVAQAQRDQAFVTFKATVLSALEDVENALVALSQERQRSSDLGRAVERYREAARLSRTLYQTGASSFLDVLDAERSLYDAEDALLQSRVSITTNYISLAKALGGGWDKPVAVDTPLVVDGYTGPRLAIAPDAAKP